MYDDDDGSDDSYDNEDDDDIQILCASNACTAAYPNNTLSKFTNQLGHHIDVADYLVSLESVCFSNNFGSDSDDKDHIAPHPHLVKVRLDQAAPCVSSAQYNDNNILVTPYVRSATKNFGTHFTETKSRQKFKLTSDVLSKLSLTLTNENGEQLPLARGQPTFVRLLLSKMPTESFPLRVASTDSSDLFPNNTPAAFKVSLRHTINVDRGEWRVALISITIPRHLSPPPDFADGEVPSVLLIYSSLVEPSAVGDRLLPLLKMIPLSGATFGHVNSSGRYTHYEAETLNYVPLNMNAIRVLEFSLKDASGNDIICRNKNAAVYINLAFVRRRRRRRRQPQRRRCY